MSILQYIYNKQNVNSILPIDCEIAIYNIFKPLINDLYINPNLIDDMEDPGFNKLFPNIKSPDDIYECFIKNYVNLVYDQMLISDIIQTPKLIYWGMRALIQLNDINYFEKYQNLLSINFYDWSKPLNKNGYTLLNLKLNLNYDPNSQELINKICEKFKLNEITSSLDLVPYIDYNSIHEKILKNDYVIRYLIPSYIPFNIYEETN